MTKEEKRALLFRVCEEAGYERAKLVYSAEVEYYRNGEIEEDCLCNFDLNGRPTLDWMKELLPDNITQIFIDEDFNIDMTVFPEFKYTSPGESILFLEKYLTYNEVVDTVDKGVNKFITQIYNV